MSFLFVFFIGLAGNARKEMVWKKAYGYDYFDRATLAFTEEGTRENPIPVLSHYDYRYVGISLPVSRNISYMVIYLEYSLGEGINISSFLLICVHFCRKTQKFDGSRFELEN
jgi:hypothetical protein